MFLLLTQLPRYHEAIALHEEKKVLVRTKLDLFYFILIRT